MGKKKKIKTTIHEAVEYWSQYIDECDLSVDWSEAQSHCWRCGCQRNLERCHIIPDSLGGSDEPSNIVLLCKRYHAEGPNVSEPEIMWDWIKAYKVTFYETFWSIRGMHEYQFIYKKTLYEEIEDILSEAGVVYDETVDDILKQILSVVGKKVSVHFGQPYINTATVAGLYRMMLKELALSYGIVFPKATDN